MRNGECLRAPFSFSFFFAPLMSFESQIKSISVILITIHFYLPLFILCFFFFSFLAFLFFPVFLYIFIFILFYPAEFIEAISRLRTVNKTKTKRNRWPNGAQSSFLLYAHAQARNIDATAISHLKYGNHTFSTGLFEIIIFIFYCTGIHVNRLTYLHPAY